MELRKSLPSVVLMLITLTTVYASLSGRLKEYGTMHHLQILEHHDHHAEKRSTRYISPAPNKIVSFTVMGRHFKLHLQSQEGLFSPDFHAEVKHHDSTSSSISLDPADFFVGYTEDEPSTSRVQVYYEGDNMVAQIKTKDDIYNIEPSWRHLAPSENISMIVYKTSDVLMEEPDQPGTTQGLSHCGLVGEQDVPQAPILPKSSDTVHSERRSKRQTISRNTCRLMLVADYHFFEVVGNSDPVNTAKYLIGVLSRVDNLYRGTDFGDGYQGFGFELQGLIIHEAATSGYNQPKLDWGSTELLNAFGDVDWRSYCLAHLFTYLRFTDGTVGLAWVAAPGAGVAGGICSPVVNGRGYNTAWTTLANKYGNRRLTLESDLVTAHEFGHNWGSQHDPSSPECSPSTNSGGKYLMYPISVTGYESNNNVFSTCSQRNILEVLKTKTFNCFTELRTSICGNLKVEDAEECDAGVEDPCCTDTCQLTSGSQCSDLNSGCCQNCQFKTSDVVCSEAVDNSVSCKAEANCTGSSADCPTPADKPNGDPCIENGECFNGECQAFCETKQLVSCLCDNVADSCKYCCRNGSEADCVLYDGGSMELPNGRTCIQGTCINGVCDKTIRTSSTRLWTVIKNLSFSAILQFMKNNVVLAVVILSLVIYIPLSIIVACVDKKRDKKDEEEVEWMSRDNDRLLSDKDNRLIRSSTHRRVPRKPTTASGVNFGPL